MSLLPSRNHRHNKAFPLPERLINGQSLGDVAQMKFGLSTMSYSGCEVIAVYNALLLAGIPQPLPDIARYMERFRVLGGFWGTNFLALGRCLKRFGLPAKRVRRRRKLAAAIGAGKICLMVYWTGRRFLSPVHTVCICQAGEGEIAVCNEYNNCDRVLHEPTEAMLAKRLIFGYVTESGIGPAGQTA
ncbi:MAG: hypothetical protein J6Z45_05295 [Oscillospiraceae bacterium]|nr:hypothetical protein [Oscillospiraceae bacterium]